MESVSSKDQEWQQMAQRFAKVTDRLGKGLDDGIKDTVIVLNLLGIHTSASCEGHIEWGTCAPWVDINAPGLREEEQRYFAAMKEAQRQQESGQLSNILCYPVATTLIRCLWTPQYSRIDVFLAE